VLKQKQLPDEIQDQQFKDESRSSEGAEEVQVGIFSLSEVFTHIVSIIKKETKIPPLFYF
jgi:hypothetical protein